MIAITQQLPHRYPFLFVDRIVEQVNGQLVRGYKNITHNEWFLEGHFPDEPIVPGVIITEAIAQLAAFVNLPIEEVGSKPKKGMLVSMKAVKFSKPVVPGDRLDLQFEATMLRGPYLKGNGQASVDGKVVCTVDEMLIYTPELVVRKETARC
ncbi:3-hydroxyacyl-[acyl-carrier-protein] dehydratase [Paenibacillus cellulosilyticus]|uniref:3-hydroxyacyl-[acyl-carrier-protein] dehydratase n=1 Tax=Paenibacillus cellulosilyticus TaxID=375489 RepID=A0A2V2YYP8_9BACL|nr:3-hydroxyacyl-ACP dehydratase FabZ [Paenibacillus cellulosilyticus]PWW06546.1 3-hydroxyacyl-[acyl-carrier-protein] dehydratase [Paenibacillus cellulosilyticus]